VVTASALTKPPRIQALARASAIIDVIAAGGDEGVGLSEISRTTALNKTTAFNLLASLVTTRFIEQDQHSKRYRLGLLNLELGRIVQHRLHISHLARPILADLCKKTNETVNLGLPDLLDLLVVDSFQGSRLLHATAYAGWRSMYH
jgi:DNA-binding IclR family transcriptional regulator